MTVYVIMKAGWQDYCSYGGDLEAVSLFGVFNNEKSAIEKIDGLAMERYNWSLEKYHGFPTVHIEQGENAEGGIYEKIVEDEDGHAYLRWWIEEQEVQS